MAELIWNSFHRLFTLGPKSWLLPTSDINDQQASGTSASPAKDIARLEESTTGSIAVQSWTDPNVTSGGGGMSGEAPAPQAEDRSRNGETVGPRDSLPQSLHANAAIQPEPPTQAVLTFGHKGNSKFGLDGPDTNTAVPYALTWTEHEMELRPVRSLKSSMQPGMTRDVFPRNNHSCTAIPNSTGEFIIFGGKSRLEGKDIWFNDVILLSTVDMSLTSLETNGAKPEEKIGHRTVIVGRALVVFGGGIDDSYLHFLNLDTREWSKLRPPAPYPGPRFGHSFITVDNTMWLFGGGRKGNRMDDMWCIDLKTEGIQYVRWRQVPKKERWPEPRAYHSTVYYDGCLYIFGGEAIGLGEQDVALHDLWKFDTRTETWTEVQCDGLLPQARSRHGAVVIGNNMFLFGGGVNVVVDKEVRYFDMDDAFAFNFRDHTWRSLAMLGQTPGAPAAGALLARDSQLILVGGQWGKKQHIHVAEAREGTMENDIDDTKTKSASTLSSVEGSYAPDSLAKLQFTTETTNLSFTTEVVDLSHFVRKQGNSAYSLAGFSDVWKGEMTETGHPIAIKVLRVTNTGNQDNPESTRLRTRFDRELTIWMECQHPRVLELLGYAYIEGIPCLISPWCSKGNILEYLTQNPNANRMQLVMQVAEGLVYLHGREPPVIHSDVKPANVLISDGGDAKICDFGISKLMMDAPSGFTTTKSANFTLRYSAKELLCESKNTMMSDVFAFGMFILEVMTNKPPFFKISSEAMVILAIVSGDVPATEDYPELPAVDPLWDIMRECWAQEPTERPTTVEVLDKLRKCDGTPQG